MKTIGSIIIAAAILWQSGGLITLSSAFKRASTLDVVMHQAMEVSK